MEGPGRSSGTGDVYTDHAYGTSVGRNSMKKFGRNDHHLRPPGLCFLPPNSSYLSNLSLDHADSYVRASSSCCCLLLSFIRRLMKKTWNSQPTSAVQPKTKDSATVDIVQDKSVCIWVSTNTERTHIATPKLPSSAVPLSLIHI